MVAERAFSVLQAVQGEGHVPFLVSNEADFSGKNLSTDSVVTRSLVHTVDVAALWESYVKLDALCLFELRWWIDNIESVSKFPIDGKLSSVAVHYGSRVASEGSGVGYFCYDFFLQTFEPGDNLWLFATPAVWHLPEQGAAGVLVVQVWPRASFFTFFFFFWPDGRHAAAG
jgi:hypothetical protein